VHGLPGAVVLIKVAQYNDFGGGAMCPQFFIGISFIRECVDTMVVVVVVVDIE